MNDEQWKEAREMAKHSSSFTIPKDIKWTVEDFKDLYFTMCRFKQRFMKRHELERRQGKMRGSIKVRFEDVLIKLR